MTNGEICTAVNALFRAVCQLKLQNDKNVLKSQMQFFTDFHTNRRALINSFVLYEYYSNSIPIISKDELDLMREFLLTYLGKFDDSNLNDVFISVTSKSMKFAFASFERASFTNDTTPLINEIENEIISIEEVIIKPNPKPKINTNIKKKVQKPIVKLEEKEDKS